MRLSKKPLYGVRGSFTQGELEGAKPASNQIKCRAKPCLARRAWSEATIFVPQGGTKITTLFQAVEKAGGFFDSLRNGAAFAAPFWVLLPRRALRLKMIVRVLENSEAGLQKCRIYLQKLHF